MSAADMGSSAGQPGGGSPPDRRGWLARVPGGPLWLAVTILLLLALAGLAVWVWLLRQPPVVEKILPAPVVTLAPEVKAKADALAAEIAALEQALVRQRQLALSATCPAGQILRQGAILPPPPPLAALPTSPALAALPPVAPASPATPAAPGSPPPAAADPAGPLKPLSSAELAARLEGATALILSEDSVATGFFIAPDLLMTNRHAVESAKGGQVMIASRSLKTVRPGQVLRASPGGQPGAADFALIRLGSGTAPAILPLTDQAPKLMPVVAAGYPGLTLKNDPGFRRLVAGDAQAAPDLNLTQGVVQSLQNSPQGVPVVLHTASILQGNSGGPLVDNCGRVVGINTFIAVDAEQSGRISYAQTTGAMAGFLAQSGARLPVDPRSCPTG